MTGTSERDALDAFGRWFLSVYEWREASVAAILIAAAAGVVRKWKRNEWGGSGALLNAALGVLSMSSGLTVAVVFILTKPPAVEAISRESAALAAVATLFSSVALGFRAVKVAAGFESDSVREQPDNQQPRATQEQG